MCVGLECMRLVCVRLYVCSVDGLGGDVRICL